ncbi:insulinase family protein [Myroides sp. 1354]|uniref:M16 family metallopeptidase n=1 Tax=unclassified Myroides TaxID=2642485 RepID=UPI002574C55E|nr:MULTISPECIES: pitrilysin family protein [unclassified Myroides]MDM1044054.1 insulinase family protein [Myroides sp. R163-1]MDM1054989.1 insulinase family protein [Myroides sp. 1354]MDM1068286.1 insulinase family protein [Myroides sp. 1372]
MKRIFYTLVLASAIGFTNFAAAQQRSKAAFVTQVEDIKEYKLSNGLQVLLLPDASQNNLVVNIVYKVGSKHEGYGEKGMAHLLEHMLFKSTKNLGDIKKMLSDKGGAANGTTYYDRTNYYEVFPSTDENLAWALEMEADRMINATILQEDLDKEFSVVRNEFEIGENDPTGVLMERTANTAYLWHNYGLSTIGSKEDIERVKTPQLRRFYEKYYQPDNAVLVVAGKFDEKKAIEYIEQHFSVIPRPTRVLDEILTVEPAQDGEKYIEVKRNGDSKHIQMLYHTASYADKDFAALEALEHILNNDPSGYLHQALVETQKVSSLWAYSPTVRDASFMLFNFDVPNDKDQMKTLADIKAEVAKIGDIAYTQADLDRAKTKLLKDIESLQNNTIGTAINLTEIIGSGDYRLAFLHRDNIENLTVEDIKRVAKKYFKDNNRTVGLFIPTKEEVRVKPTEFLNTDIEHLVKDYKGKETSHDIRDFAPTIANLEQNYTSGQLSNGLKYGIIDKDLKGEKVNISINIPIGNQKDLHNKQYVGSFTASMLTSGTKALSKQDIQDKLDNLKSSISIRFNEQTISIFVNSYRSTIKETMDLLDDVLKNPSFPESELTKMKLEYTTYLESNLNDPQQLAFTKIAQATSNEAKGSIFYASSIQEDIDGVKAVTTKEIKDFYAKFFGANNGIATVLGMQNQAEAKELLERVLGNWNSNAKFERAYPTFFGTKQGKEIVQTPDKENAAAVGQLNFQMNKSNPDYAALTFANEVMGGGFMTARIPQRLREKEGISYGAGTSLSVPSNVNNNNSSWMIYAFLNPTKRGEVETAINEEFAKLVANGITEEELKANKISWKSSRQTNLGSDNFLMSLSNLYLTYDIPFNDFDKLNTDIEKLTVKQVNAAIKKYLQPSKFTTIYVGDFSKK